MRSVRFLAVALLLSLSLLGCSKSDSDQVLNLFGAAPTVGEFTIVKERKDFEGGPCVTVDGLCALFGVPDTITERKVSIDRISFTVRVDDATGPGDILVVIARFLDPPLEVGGTNIQQISLEMFDTGPNAVAQISTPSGSVPVLSGDLVAGDGVYSRTLYFGTNTLASPGTCIQETDLLTQGFTFSTYTTVLRVDPTDTIPYQFMAEAIDDSGNLAATDDVPTPVLGTFREITITQAPTCP